MQSDKILIEFDKYPLELSIVLQQHQNIINYKWHANKHMINPSKNVK